MIHARDLPAKCWASAAEWGGKKRKESNPRFERLNEIQNAISLRIGLRTRKRSRPVNPSLATENTQKPQEPDGKVYSVVYVCVFFPRWAGNKEPASLPFLPLDSLVQRGRNRFERPSWHRRRHCSNAAREAKKLWIRLNTRYGITMESETKNEHSSAVNSSAKWVFSGSWQSCTKGRTIGRLLPRG